VIGNDAELVFRFENTAQALVEERNQLFRGETHLFRKFKYPNFSGSQSLPFTLQAQYFPARERLHVPSPYMARSFLSVVATLRSLRIGLVQHVTVTI
jgi:hypothetical protein